MKQELYKWVKVGGLLSIIPIVLVTGPILGYLAGDFLVKRFNLHFFVIYIFAAIGFISSIRETIRIIRLALGTSKEG